MKKYDIELKEESVTLKGLLQWIKDNLLKERPELFLQDETVYVIRCEILLICRRPGILVLINDCDWELMGGLEYNVEPNDTIVFISTLHGG